MIISNARELSSSVAKSAVVRILEAGLEALAPEKVVNERIHLHGDHFFVDSKCWELDRFRRVFIVGAGKGSSRVVAALERLLGSRLSGGFVIDTVRFPLRKVKFLKGTHPIPSELNLRSSRKLLALVDGLDAQDFLVCAFTGGGSALLEDSVVPPARLKSITRDLLRSGASISEINTIRRHLSRVKGGWLAERASPATVLSLLVSDVPGDRIEAIASGPTVFDRSTSLEAGRVARKYGLGTLPFVETPKKLSSFARVTNVLLLSNSRAVDAMENAAMAAGLRPVVVSKALQGEARNVGRWLAGRSNPKGVALIAAGETTVTVKGSGKGGRNQELVLGALGVLPEGAAIGALDTDGIDFIKEAAGAVADWRDASRARTKGLDPLVFLSKNDSFTFFKRLGKCNVVTGPTGVNVADIMVAVRI